MGAKLSICCFDKLKALLRLSAANPSSGHENECFAPWHAIRKHALALPDPDLLFAAHIFSAADHLLRQAHTDRN